MSNLGSVKDLHAKMIERGVHKLCIISDNDVYVSSDKSIGGELCEYLQNSPDSASHEAIFIGTEENLDTLFFAFVHNTKRGLAQGGMRFKRYDSLGEVLSDGLRLSQGMTRKNAFAGLWWGGGKAVMPLPEGVDESFRLPNRELYLKAAGRFVASLGGIYYTAADMGTGIKDMRVILSANTFTTCLPEDVGGSGDPSPYTARGVFHSMQSAWKFMRGTDDLKGVRVAVEGVGHVGQSLVEMLLISKASVSIYDNDRDKVLQLKKQYPQVHPVLLPTSIYEQEVDIFSPCATGGTIHSGTIPLLSNSSVKLVCGGANNILKEPERHSKELKAANIEFVPDFINNRMGIMNCADEWMGYHGYTDEDINNNIEKISEDTYEVLKKAKEQNKTSTQVANEWADEILASQGNHPLYGNRPKKIIQYLKDHWVYKK